MQAYHSCFSESVILVQDLEESEEDLVGEVDILEWEVDMTALTIWLQVWTAPVPMWVWFKEECVGIFQFICLFVMWLQSTMACNLFVCLLTTYPKSPHMGNTSPSRTCVIQENRYYTIRKSLYEALQYSTPTIVKADVLKYTFNFLIFL